MNRIMGENSELWKEKSTQCMVCILHIQEIMDAGSMISGGGLSVSLNQPIKTGVGKSAKR